MENNSAKTGRAATAERAAVISLHAVMDVSSKIRGEKIIFSLQPVSAGLCNDQRVPPGPPGPFYRLINWQSDGRKALEVC